MKNIVVAAALLGCGEHHRESISDPIELPAPVPADASPWHGDTIDWPTGPRDDAAAIGTEHPIRWAEVDPKRRWVLLCDFREDTDGDGTIGDTKPFDGMDEIGDAPAMYVVLGSGAGRRVDRVLAVSPTGDHLAIVTDGAVAVLDADKHVAQRIAGARPFAVFSGDGKRLVYVAGTDVVRRELATGAETRTPLPKGEPALMDLDTSGRWLVVALARGGDRGTSWLTAAWGLRPVCSLEMMHLGVPLREAVEKVWIDLDHGTVRDDQTIVRIVGDHVLAQPTIDKLVLDGKNVAPADCAAIRTFAVHEAPFALLAGCKPKQGADRIELLAPRHVVVDKTPLMSIDVPDQLAPMTHAREECDVASDCIDLVTGAKRKLDFVDLPMGVHGGEGWYAGTRTHLLVGSPEHGPLHWRAQTKDDR